MDEKKKQYLYSLLAVLFPPPSLPTPELQQENRDNEQPKK